MKKKMAKEKLKKIKEKGDGFWADFKKELDAALEAGGEHLTVPTEETEVTEPETQAPTQAPAETEDAPTEEPSEEEDFLAGKSWIGIVIIAGVLTVLIAGALIFRTSGRGGKYMR